MALIIKIASPQRAVAIDRKRLRSIAAAVLRGEGVTAAAVSIAFVDDPTIHRLNKSFLDHDQPTDVLTFPLSGPGAKTLEGEIVIGAEVARAVAAERRHDVGEEISLYAIHGLLHLCGYDDVAVAARRRMRARERHYLHLLGLPPITEPTA
jgi:probable rRNA maturation factor